MNNNENKNISKNLLLIIVAILLCIVSGIGIGYKIYKANNEVLNENEEVENSNDEINNDNSENNQRLEDFEKKIELTKENETIKIGDYLLINFKGKKSNETEEGYKYQAEIYLDNKKVETDFYNSNNIWSSDYAAYFSVSKIKSYYIFISYIAKQCDGSYVLIINDEGEVITNYSDVNINIDKENNKYTVENCNTCGMDEVCTEETYNLEDNYIKGTVNRNNYNVTYYEDEKEQKVIDIYTGNNKYELKIENNKVVISDLQTNEKYTLKSINNVKSINQSYGGVSTGDKSYFILTTDGKVYYTDNYKLYYSIKNVLDFEDIFKLIDTNTKIIKIGYAEVKEFKENGYPIIPLVLKTEDKEFMYYYMNDEKIIYEIK